MYPAPLFYGGVPALHPAYTALAVGAEGAEAKAAAGEGEGGSQVGWGVQGTRGPPVRACTDCLEATDALQH